MDRIDQDDLPLDDEYEYFGTGYGVHVYVLDSGMLLTHEDFTGRIGTGYDFVDNDSNPTYCTDSRPPTVSIANFEALKGQGTHVAGIIGGSTSGVAKGVTIHPLRVGSCYDTVDVEDAIDALEWVINNHQSPAVVNMSFGGDSASYSEDNAVREVIDEGITVVVTAGNIEANACNYSPSRVDEAITVGATEINDARWYVDGNEGSNYGACVDLFAPGRLIYSAWHDGNSEYGYQTGCSQAAPHVAGVAALYLERNNSAAPDEVMQAIVMNTTPGKVTSPGSGSPNLLLFRPPNSNTYTDLNITGTADLPGNHHVEGYWDNIEFEHCPDGEPCYNSGTIVGSISGSSLSFSGSGEVEGFGQYSTGYVLYGSGNKLYLKYCDPDEGGCSSVGSITATYYSSTGVVIFSGTLTTDVGAENQPYINIYGSSNTLVFEGCGLGCGTAGTITAKPIRY